MARVKRPVSKETQELLGQLGEAGAICTQLEALLANARAHRDRLALRATESGATRRDVAQAAGITAGRVQQLAG